MSVAIAFEAASARYGERSVLSCVTAEFDAAAVTGIVGPNGAGKTTLLRAALGLAPLSSGTVRILGRSLAQWSREGLARAVAYLPQDADAHWPVAARHLVSLGRLPHRARFAPAGTGDLEAVNEALVRCDALAFAERRLDELSAGERARVMFARALATRAQILLADEPAAYLDPAHQLRLMELLREEADRGTAVAVTLHDLSLASRFCDRVIVLDNGNVASAGRPDIALSDAVLAGTFGIDAVRARGPVGPAAVVAWNRI